MTRYLLDTNVISEATRPHPSVALTAWLGRQADTDLFIATLTLAEIKRGILEKQPGRKRRELETWFDGPEGPRALFSSRILPFDEQAALAWASLMVEGTRAGQPRSALDMVIAAIATSRECVLVTTNERHFQNCVKLINPLKITN
jgi:predicted nucleic acid-binding protein